MYEMLRDTNAKTCSTTMTNQVQFFQLNADIRNDRWQSNGNSKNENKTKQNRAKQNQTKQKTWKMTACSKVCLCCVCSSVCLQQIITIGLPSATVPIPHLDCIEPQLTRCFITIMVLASSSIGRCVSLPADCCHDRGSSLITSPD